MDRTIRREFPEYGDGCFVTIKNPALAPANKLAPPRHPKGDSVEDSLRVSVEWLTWFILDMSVPIFDVDNWDSDPETCTQITQGNFAKIPGPITAWIAEQVQGVNVPS